jgi:hypothetical protein
MKERTILQRITDTLEANGIGVSGIETWPPDEDGRVSVSLTVRPPARKSGMNPEEDKTEALIAALNKARDPSRPPAVRDPCADCRNGDCETCPTSPANSTPIKLYTPEEAAAALKEGRILQNEEGDKFYWKSQFCRVDKEGAVYVAGHLSGLYEEGKYV